MRETRYLEKYSLIAYVLLCCPVNLLHKIFRFGFILGKNHRISMQVIDIVECLRVKDHCRSGVKERLLRERQVPLSYAIPEHLLRNHPDRPQPRLHQLRPSRDRKLRAPQPKRMPALGVQMHLHWNPSLLQRNVVSQRVVHVVHVVILSLQQKRRRRLAGHRNFGIQRKMFIGIGRMREPQTFWCLAWHPTPPRKATDVPDR